jgi:hypothetical protein
MVFYRYAAVIPLVLIEETQLDSPQNMKKIITFICIIIIFLNLLLILPAKSFEIKVSPKFSSINDVKLYVNRQASLLGLTDNQIDIADFIIQHESNYCWRNGFFEPDIKGDLDKGISRGCWQISKTYHPEVSDNCANDLECSTNWSLLRIKNSYQNDWSTWKYRKLWYQKKD